MSTVLSAGNGPTALLDQAGDLRRIVEEKRQELRHRGRGSHLRTLAVLSGKGGVGKSNVSVSLSCALADQGKRVVLLDADLGMANLDILCGVSAKYNLSHLVTGSRELNEILIPLEKRVFLLPGGVGLKEMADLDDEGMERVFDLLMTLEDQADILILDTGAGIHKGVLSFAHAADMTLLVTTPEPTSVRDAYGVIKSLGGGGQKPGEELMLVVNMAGSRDEAREVAERIRMASMQFLGNAPAYLGYILRDDSVERAVRSRKIFYRSHPSSSAANCIKRLTNELLRLWEGRPVPVEPKGLRSFFLRLTRNFFVER
ncbi:MAG: MinD/ParA family protein [Fretibacterium sp.]|nr:MinD/ParA family protein [Fretibacterium sp.]